MVSFKNVLAIAALSFGFATTSMAQAMENGKEYAATPYIFFGVQGGFQNTITQNYSTSKLITPTASVSVGAMFTPVVGARLHVNGMWNKGGIVDPYDAKYEYKYLTTNLDLMLNLVTMFGKYNYYPVNLYLIGGVGLNTAWANGDANTLFTESHSQELDNLWNGTKMHHNFRVGLQMEVNLSKNVGVNVEFDANSVGDRFNSKLTNHDDWQLTAQVGVNFKFGYRKPKAVVQEYVAPVVAAVETVAEVAKDTVWYDDITYKEVTRDREIKKEIFFSIRESGVKSADQQIKEVAEFLKTVKDGEVTITSYADKGTGNPRINMKYSKLRAEKTKAALIAAGVDPALIKTVEWKGDTVQPYAENEKNRLSVIKGHGVYTDKDKVVTKKFRLEDSKK